jgi:hypothetical protein
MVLVAFDGTRAGERIPGSRYVRGFCERCNASMRVPEEACLRARFCEECDPPHRAPFGHHSGPLDEDFGGYHTVAKKFLEEK